MAAFAKEDLSLKNYVDRLIEADKQLCSLNNMGWKESVTKDDAWNYCRDIYNDKIGDLPKIEILKKLGESNGKEHGKRFEENLKLLSSLVFTKITIEGQPFLTKDESNKILTKIPGYTKRKPRTFKTIPMTKVYFLEETEHKNDEKDIDTEQILNVTSILKNNNKADKNPLKNKGIRSKYSWDYDEEKLKSTRDKVRNMIGSGVNIKCARFGNDNGKTGDEYECYPKAIDCASCITFWEETKRGGEEKWIFVVGVWDQDEKNKENEYSNVKCLKGVWFLEMDGSDLKNLWGCEDNEDDKKEMDKNITDIHNKIEALKRFNKQRKTKKEKAQIQRAHLKGLYYYGNIEKIEERLRDKTGNINATWWNDDAIKQCKKEKENMTYGGCVPLLNTLTEILTKTRALLKYTPKVQLDKAQARLQCNITGSNFIELIERKRKTGKAIFSRDFTYLFRPIIPVQGKSQKGGGGERREQYDEWLKYNGAIESDEDFFFEGDTAYGFPIFLNSKKTIEIINKSPELKKEFTNKEFYIPDIFDDIDEDPDDIEDDNECEDTKFPELEGIKKHEYLVLHANSKASAQMVGIDERYKELIEEAENWGLTDDRFQEYKNLVELTAKSSVSRPRLMSGMDAKNYKIGPRRRGTSGSIGSIFGSPLQMTNKIDETEIKEKPLAILREKSIDSDDISDSATIGSSSSNESEDDSIGDDSNTSVSSHSKSKSAFSGFTGDLRDSLESDNSSKKESAKYTGSDNSGEKHRAKRRINTEKIDKEEEDIKKQIISRIEGMSLGQLNRLKDSIGNIVNTSPTPLLTGIVSDITKTDQLRENRMTSFSLDSARDAFGAKSPRRIKRSNSKKDVEIRNMLGISKDPLSSSTMVGYELKEFIDYYNLGHRRTDIRSKIKEDFSRKELEQLEELMNEFEFGEKQTEIIKSYNNYLSAIKDDSNEEIQQKKEVLKMLIKGRKKVYTPEKMEEIKGRERKKAVIELLKSKDIPFNDDIVDEHIDGINNLMDLSEGEYTTFEDALDVWPSYDNFSEINNKKRGGGKRKKKKKKTRRKRKKKKKKTRTKK